MGGGGGNVNRPQDINDNYLVVSKILRVSDFVYLKILMLTVCK